MSRPIQQDAQPESLGWRYTRRMNYSYKYREHWLVMWCKADGWGYGVDGGWNTTDHYSTWQEAATAACNYVDRLISDEKALS